MYKFFMLINIVLSAMKIEKAKGGLCEKQKRHLVGKVDQETRKKVTWGGWVDEKQKTSSKESGEREIILLGCLSLA